MNRLSAKSTHFFSFVRFLTVALVVSALVLVAAVPATAQDPTSAQYDNAAVQVNGVGDSGSSSSSPAKEASGLQKNVIGGLPFTGLDVIALAAVAVALASIGFALRRLTPRRD